MSGLGGRASKGPGSALGELSGSQTPEPDQTGCTGGLGGGVASPALGVTLGKSHPQASESSFPK